MNYTFDENEDANEPNQGEDVSESVDNYEDNKFDESSNEEVGLNVVLKGTLETGNSSETDNLSQMSFLSSVKLQPMISNKMSSSLRKGKTKRLYLIN